MKSSRLLVKWRNAMFPTREKDWGIYENESWWPGHSHAIPYPPRPPNKRRTNILLYPFTNQVVFAMTPNIAVVYIGKLIEQMATEKVPESRFGLCETRGRTIPRGPRKPPNTTSSRFGRTPGPVYKVSGMISTIRAHLPVGRLYMSKMSWLFFKHVCAQTYIHLDRSQEFVDLTMLQTRASLLGTPPFMPSP